MGRQRNLLIYRIGDHSSPEEYGGGALMKCGVHYVLEYTHGADGLDLDRFNAADRKKPLTVYGVCVDSDREGARSDLAWADWGMIARCLGIDPWEIFALALSDDPRKLAALYEMVANVEGWAELDSYPLELPYWQVARRWNGMDERQRAARTEQRRLAEKGRRKLLNGPAR